MSWFRARRAVRDRSRKTSLLPMLAGTTIKAVPRVRGLGENVADGANAPSGSKVPKSVFKQTMRSCPGLPSDFFRIAELKA